MLNGRDPRIDFFRGLALIFIFWDHVPHNPLGQITLRNIGFSDAAESLCSSPVMPRCWPTAR